MEEPEIIDACYFMFQVGEGHTTGGIDEELVVGPANTTANGREPRGVVVPLDPMQSPIQGREEMPLIRVVGDAIEVPFNAENRRLALIVVTSLNAAREPGFSVIKVPRLEIPELIEQAVT